MGSEVRDSLDAYVAFQLAELEGCLPLVAAADQEAVHGARLALRRLRSVLSCYGPYLPTVPAATRQSIRWLAHSLGEARDDYVLAQRMTLWLDARDVWLSGDALRAAVAGLVDSSNNAARRIAGHPRARETLEATAWAVLSVKDVPEEARLPDIRSAVALLQGAWETAHASLSKVPDLPTGRARSEQLHQARKDIKGLRYSVEAIAGSLGNCGAAITQPSMTLQRTLGEHHDSVTSLAWITGLAIRPGIEASDVRELRLMERRRLREVEAGIQDALRASPIPEPRHVLAVLEPSGTLAPGTPPSQSHSAM